MSASKHFLKVFGLVLAVGCLFSGLYSEISEPKLTLENFWTLRGLSSPKWSPDSSRIAFTLSQPESDSSEILTVDLDGRIHRFNEYEIGEGEVARKQFGFMVGLLPEPWTPDGKRILYLSRGNIHALEVETGKSETLVQLGGRSKGYTPQVYFNGPDPVLSPDGTRMAFIRESELWVLDMKKGAIRQLTTIHPEGWHSLQPMWSPDSRRILFTSQAIDNQRPFPFLDFSGTVIDVHLGLIGTGRVRIGIISADGGETLWIGPQNGIAYSLRGGSNAFWSPDGRTIAINRISLDHTMREIILASPDSGETRVIWEEKVDHWISPLAIWLRWAPDSSRILFTSEKDGWNHMYVLPVAGGSPKQITSGAFTVTSNQVYDQSETTPDWSIDGKTIYFPSNEAGTPERHLYAVSSSGGPRKKIVGLKGLNVSSTISPDGKHIAFLHSNPTNPPEMYLESIEGGRQIRITDLAIPIPLREYRWISPQIISFPNRSDGTVIKARLHVPEKIDRSKKHPAVIYVHGAGYNQSVFFGWQGLDRLAFNHYLAQEGYIVLDVDFRGSAGYGAKFRVDVFDRLGDIDLDDVLSGVEYLQSLGYVDLTRIGIWGHSYGGFMVCSAMFRAPEVFAAGVAGAPVTDWERFYYLAPGYNEEHLGFPWVNPEGTLRASPLTYAKDLKRPFLLLSGVQDVMHLDSAALVNELLKYRKSFDWYFYPNEPHGMRQPQSREDYYRRIAHFFSRHLN
ncbi:MAG: alpha/beta fold hydrolase [Acidobacteriota bacterium]|nr:alpha/beta fold hydrolase [Acidobacteriota bacterium]